jgi:hypothetical protein
MRTDSDCLDKIEKGGFVGRIFYDEDPQSPKDWDQLGTMITWHRRHVFDLDGGKQGFEHGQDWLDANKTAIDSGDLVYINVGMGDHSGIWLYEGEREYPGAEWDSGQVGFLFCWKSDYEKMCDQATEGWQAKALECLRAELTTWDQWARGDIYGYTIEDPSGEVVDSCWGFYGNEAVKAEMIASLDHYVREAEAGEKLEKDHFRI